jgi:hypothetical protein
MPLHLVKRYQSGELGGLAHGKGSIGEVGDGLAAIVTLEEILPNFSGASTVGSAGFPRTSGSC